MSNGKDLGRFGVSHHQENEVTPHFITAAIFGLGHRAIEKRVELRVGVNRREKNDDREFRRLINVTFVLARHVINIHTQRCASDPQNGKQ